MEIIDNDAFYEYVKQYDPEALRKALIMIAQGIERGRNENDEAVSKE